MPKISIKVARGDGSHYFTEADVTEEGAKDMTRHEGVTRGPASQKSSIATSETTVAEAAKREDTEAPERIAFAQTDEDKDSAKAAMKAAAEARGEAIKTTRRRVKRGGRTTETTTQRRATR